MMIRKQTLLDVGGFEESREIISVEDLNLASRIALTDQRFVRSEADLFKYSPLESSLSSNDFRMAGRELANLELVSRLVHCDPQETRRIQSACRVEYARNLIACRQWEQAATLLREPASGLAYRFLRFVLRIKARRLARKDLLHFLLSLERKGAPRCSLECTLTEKQKECCLRSQRDAYTRK
jgi:hypothetical protein